ncbi:MAG: hypothetical protein IJV02_03490 [Candidatus Methanomethylophilaceae archaeon]|nr:hypothetical protein [Candidatus Methanomethylophilaceae archaeon]
MDFETGVFGTVNVITLHLAMDESQKETMWAELQGQIARKERTLTITTDLAVSKLKEELEFLRRENESLRSRVPADQLNDLVSDRAETENGDTILIRAV